MQILIQAFPGALRVSAAGELPGDAEAAGSTDPT